MGLFFVFLGYYALSYFLMDNLSLCDIRKSILSSSPVGGGREGTST